MGAHRHPARCRPHTCDAAAPYDGAPRPTRRPRPRAAVAMWRRCEPPGGTDAVTLPAPAQQAPVTCASSVWSRDAGNHAKHSLLLPATSSAGPRLGDTLLNALLMAFHSRAQCPGMLSIQ